MGTRFNALSKAEQTAIAAYVSAEYDKLLFQQPTTYVSMNAQADPEHWQNGMRELIASDPKRVWEIMETAHTKNGFTLIEMSVVLVIIGLIVGAVLVGQSMIAAAGARAQISQIEKYNQAVNTFRGKYGYLPGDIKDPDASMFGFLARGPQPGEGDGNGTIAGNANSALAVGGLVQVMGETRLFWEDLSQAGLIPETFSSGRANNNPGPVSGSALSQWFPPAKIGQGNYVYVWSSDPGYPWPTVNYFGVGAITGLGATIPYYSAITPNIPVSQAFAIDSKIDDGKPYSGHVIAVYGQETPYIAFDNSGTSNSQYWWLANSGTPTSCTDNSGVANVSPYTTPSGWRYSIGVNSGSGPNCALSFPFQ